MAFAAKTLFVLLDSGRVFELEGIVDIQHLPEDPTAADTDPLIQAYLQCKETFRNDEWPGTPGIAFTSPEDGAVSTDPAKAWLPDSVMGVEPHVLRELVTHWVFVGSDGCLYQYPSHTVAGWGPKMPVRVGGQ